MEEPVAHAHLGARERVQERRLAGVGVSGQGDVRQVRPSFGSWVTYGLGSENENLPAFVVLISTPSTGTADQGLLSRLWGSGFLPTSYQGVPLRSTGAPILNLENPPAIGREDQRRFASAPDSVLRKIDNCGVHVVEGRHRTYISNFIRDGKSGGCAGMKKRSMAISSGLRRRILKVAGSSCRRR